MNKKPVQMKFAGMEFERHVYDLAPNPKQVQFTEKTKQTDMIAFNVVCNGEGILLRGDMSKPIRKHSDLQDFAAFIAMCWEEHKKLTVTLTSDLAGHKPI